ncbi:MAG: MoxR family ATPase [Methanobacteriaceae archaeon]|nr:MoxR family ATPase [Methanobacteriaceae archaeon]
MNSVELDLEEISKLLSDHRYIADDKIITTIYLSLKLEKPILIEGPPGTGKTELPKAISKALDRDFYRIQCYEGITFEQIVGEWNYQKQLMNLEISRIKDLDEDIFQEEYFIKRPLLSAFINKNPSIILIDEIDKADEEVESFLLQALGEKQITVNDLGTYDLRNDLMVIMTSNSQRILLDETKDRCLYLYIDYPSFEREMEIVKSQVPDASSELIEKVVKIIHKIREMSLMKKPSIRATIDWVKTLLVFKKDEIDDETINRTIGVVLKNQEDKEKVSKHLFK